MSSYIPFITGTSVVAYSTYSINTFGKRMRKLDRLRLKKEGEKTAASF